MVSGQAHYSTDEPLIRRLAREQYSPAHVAQSPRGALSPPSTDMLQGGPSGKSGDRHRALPAPRRLFQIQAREIMAGWGREPGKEREERRSIEDAKKTVTPQ